MGAYCPILYHRALCPRCSRVKRAIRSLGVEVEMRSVLFSRRHRHELRELVGQVRVPCLVVAGHTVVGEAEEIERFLRLRYGQQR